MRVVVPFAAREPKTRLADVLTPAEREEFSRAMLGDVLEAIRETDHELEVLATAPLAVEAPVTVDERSLTTAVNEVLAEAIEPVAIVMADLGLATPAALDRLFDTSGEVVLVPGRGGGTNTIVTRHPDFRVDYHGTSYLDHLRIAHELGASVNVVDSHRLSTDVDEPDELLELYLHGEGSAREWLVEAGFEPTVQEGRTRLERSE